MLSSAHSWIKITSSPKAEEIVRRSPIISSDTRTMREGCPPHTRKKDDELSFHVLLFSDMKKRDANLIPGVTHCLIPAERQRELAFDPPTMKNLDADRKWRGMKLFLVLLLSSQVRKLLQSSSPHTHFINCSETSQQLRTSRGRSPFFSITTSSFNETS